MLKVLQISGVWRRQFGYNNETKFTLGGHLKELRKFTETEVYMRKSRARMTPPAGEVVPYMQVHVSMQ